MSVNILVGKPQRKFMPTHEYNIKVDLVADDVNYVSWRCQTMNFH